MLESVSRLVTRVVLVVTIACAIACVPSVDDTAAGELESKQLAPAVGDVPRDNVWIDTFTGYDLKSFRASMAWPLELAHKSSILHVSRTLEISKSVMVRFESKRDKAIGCELGSQTQIHTELTRVIRSTDPSTMLLDIPFRKDTEQQNGLSTFSVSDFKDLIRFFLDPDCTKPQEKVTEAEIKGVQKTTGHARNLGKLIAAVRYSDATKDHRNYDDIVYDTVIRWVNGKKNVGFRASFIQAIARAHLIRRTLLESIANAGSPKEKQEKKKQAFKFMDQIMRNVVCAKPDERLNPEELLRWVQAKYPEILNYAAPWHIPNRIEKAQHPDHYLRRFRRWLWRYH